MTDQATVGWRRLLADRWHWASLLVALAGLTFGILAVVGVFDGDDGFDEGFTEGRSAALAEVQRDLTGAAGVLALRAQVDGPPPRPNQPPGESCIGDVCFGIRGLCIGDACIPLDLMQRFPTLAGR